MAHFIGYVKGTKGEASRLGDKKNGLRTTANGWNIGARVRLHHNGKTEEDEIIITLTSGSNGYGPEIRIGTYTEKSMQLIKAVTR